MYWDHRKLWCSHSTPWVVILQHTSNSGQEWRFHSSDWYVYVIFLNLTKPLSPVMYQQLCLTYHLNWVKITFVHVFLVDCVGVISAASQEKLWIKDGQMTKMIIIELQDPRFCFSEKLFITLTMLIIIIPCSIYINFRGKIKCNLIGSVVNPIAEFLASTWTVRPIVVLQLVKVNRCRGGMWILLLLP